MSVKPFSKSGGTYVGIRLDEKSVAIMVALQQSLGLKNPLDAEKFHTTVLYSRNPVEVVPLDKVHEATIKYIDCWEQRNGKYAVVAKLKCESLEERHDDLISIGGTHDFPSYQPHITLSYNDYITPMLADIDVVLSGEYVEPLDLDWAEDNE